MKLFRALTGRNENGLAGPQIDDRSDAPSRTSEDRGGSPKRENSAGRSSSPFNGLMRRMSSRGSNSGEDGLGADKPSGWKRIQLDLTTATREELVHSIMQDTRDPDLAQVMRLGHILLESGLNGKQKNRNPNEILVGTLLMDWAATKGLSLTPAMERLLGYAHSETWLTSGVNSEVWYFCRQCLSQGHFHHFMFLTQVYSLERAKALYETALLHMDIASDPGVWLEYSQVLLFIGDFELGAKTTALIASKFADTPNSPIYLLNAAAMYCALGQFEQAGKFMFQSIQAGPPRFFNKSEMLFLLSRTFEQSGITDDSRAEDGYKMVGSSSSLL
jgi:hypothetical protein